MKKVVFILASLLLTLNCTYAQELRDPTQPSYYSAGDNVYQERLRQSYRLHSVLVGPDRRVAVINGKRVRVGEKVDEAVVQKISKSSVTLQIPGTVFVINLAGKNFKKTTGDK